MQVHPKAILWAGALAAAAAVAYCLAARASGHRALAATNQPLAATVQESPTLPQAPAAAARVYTTLPQRPVALPPPSSSASLATGMPHPPSPEEAKRISDERIARAIADHEQEPVDLRWSRDAEVAFGGDLESLSKRAGFQVDGIDCRSTSCLVKMNWGDRPGTKSDIQAILSYSYAYNCVRTIFPTPGGVPMQQMTAIFDCNGVTPP